MTLTARFWAGGLLRQPGRAHALAATRDWSGIGTMKRDP